MLVKSQNINGSLGHRLMRAKYSVFGLLNQKARLAFAVLLLIPLSAMAVDIQVANYDDTPDPVPATQTVTYNMVVENSAADTALNVVANATVPAGMTFISATPSVGSCSFSAPNVQCPLGNLLGTLGGGAPVTIAIVMRATAAGGSSVSSTASATTDSGDTNPGNNSLPPQTTTITSGADLALTVSDSPDPVNGSGVITYTLLSENLGPDSVVNARIVNTLPPSVSYISATGAGWSCSVAGQVVTCNRADTQPAGVLPQLVIQGRVNVGSGNITNSATIDSPATPDGLPGNNTVTTNTAVNPGADVQITKGVSPNPVIANQTATFTLNTTNNGPSVASNVQVLDSLPSGFTILTATGAGYTCGISGQDVTCDRATFASGASSTITITATAPAVVPPAGLSTSNTATIATSTFDGNNANNTGTVNFTVNPAQADLSITKAKTPSPVAQGSNMSSTIIVRNNGPLAATSPVAMTDSLSSGETFVSASGTNWTCAHSGPNPGGIVTCSYVNLPVGVNSSPLTIVTTATNTGNLENQACTGGSAIGGNTHPEGDVNTVNDCANATSNSTGQIADLAIVKSIPDAGDNPLLPTDNSLTYRLTISNSGPNTSTNVVVTDAIPMYTSSLGGSGFSFVANAGSAGAVGSCANSGATVTCNYNQLQNGETAVIDITVSRPLLDGPFTNTASITSTSIGDPNPANNSSSIASTVQPVADVEMTGKSVTPSTVQAGVNSTYVLTFRNNGPSVAENVTVTDVFNPAVGDAGFTVISVASTKGSCAGLVVGTSYSAGTPTLTCNIGSMSPAEGQTVTIVIRPNYMAVPPSPRTLANTASVITTTRESDGPPSTVNTNNSKNGLLTITPASLDLLINKTDNSPYGPDPIGYDPVTPANNVFAYRIRVTNLGPSYATGVVFTDTITTPGGKSLSFLGDTAVLGVPAAGICSGTASPFSGSGAYTCTVPAGIEAGATYERVLYFRAESSPAGGGDTFSDSVVVTSNEADTNAGNNTAVEITTVRVRTDLAVTSKTATPNPVNLREPFNWTIVVTNNGPGDASNPRLSDTLPANMELTGTPTFTKTSPAGGPTNCTGTAGATSFTCDLGAFNNTATATITVPVRITSYSASYTNSASISTQGLEVDPIAGNNSNTGNVAMVKSSVAGTVFRDFNDDGIIDGGETGIAGVQMRLTGTDAYDNSVLVNATTNASGQYLFDNLPPSNGAGYTVIEVAQPATFTDGKDRAGTIDAVVVGTPGADNASDSISTIVLPSNKAAINYNFGEIPPVSVTGNVFNDTNGLNDTFVNGSGTNAGSGTLTAYLVRAGLVVSSSPVAAGGTFSLPAAANTTGYTVVLSNTAGVANGAAPPAPSLPAGWVNTGENNAAPAVAGSDGAINGVSASFDVPLTTVPNRNFGIEQPPTAGTATYPVQTNPGGTGTLPVGAGAFTGVLPGGVVGSNATDPTAVTNIKITAFPSNVTSITINGTTYTSGTFPPSGLTVTVAELAGMNVDPIDGLNTIDIPYVAIDAAGQESNLGHVILPFTGVTVSGNVYDDANGLLGVPANTVDGVGTNAGSATLTAYLVNNAGNVAGVSPVLATGVFSFGGVTSATGYTVVLSNNATGTLGNPPPAPSLPTNWVNTGENNAASTVVGNDGIVNGISAPFDVVGADVIDRNFGIDQLPDTTNVTGAVQPNPGGTIQVQVPTLIGSDPEDGAKGAGNTFIISTLPDPATMGLLYYNGVLVTAGQIITNYDPTLLTIDPVDGALSAVFTVASVDAAGKVDPTPATVTVPFSQLIITGNVFNDVDGSKVKNGAENSVIPAGLNAVLTDATGVVVAVVAVDASGNFSLPASPNTTYSVVITTANPAIGAATVPVTLPTGWVTTGENLATVIDGTPDSKHTFTTGVVDRVDVNFGIAQPTASVSGIVWRDTDHNRAFGPGETKVANVIVEIINPAGTVVGTATTDANGAYSVTSLPPGEHRVRFRDTGGGSLIIGTPTYNDAVPNTLVGGSVTNPDGTQSTIDTTSLLKVNLVAGVNLPNQSLPLDPGGVVYNSVTRAPVPGAVVTLLDGAGNSVDNACLQPGTPNAQVTGGLGIYQFLLVNPAPGACQGSGIYTLQVVQPAGYLPPASTIIPPTAGNHTPVADAGDGLVDDIQEQSVPPTGAEPTIYYFGLNLTLGGVGVVNNHIPLDPILNNAFIVTKTGNKSVAEIGDTVMYTVQARLLQGLTVTELQLIDNLPAGFRYIPGTATYATGSNAATALADPLPVGNKGPQLTFQIGPFAPAATLVTVTYKVRVGVGAMQSDGINRVRGVAPGGLVSNTAQYKVKVTGGVFTNDACVAGKVFVDCNNNHIQDAEELGIPGVRMYMEDGTYFITDVEGKYSYCGISPKTHVLKVDSLTMPRGSRLTTTSNRNAGDGNSLFLDTKNGELIRADFAEGSCSNTVLEQVKARRTGGEVRAPETEKKGGPAIKFEGKSPRYPQQGTDSANQKLVKPRGGVGDSPVSNTVNDTPVQGLPDASGNTRGNNLRDQKGEGK